MTAETPREIALEIVAIGDRTWRMDVLARAVLAAPEHVETRDWPRLPCDDMQPERIAPAEKPAREVVGYRVRYGVGKFAHKSGVYWGDWSDDMMIAKRWAERPAAPHGWRVVRVTRKVRP